MSPIGYTQKSETVQKEIKYYKDQRGVSPFLEWLEGLEDEMTRTKIKLRIDRIVRGNFGHSRSLGAGLFELKIDLGPGYRVYFGMLKDGVVGILYGGSKRTQSRDIEKARRYWETGRDESYEKERNEKKLG